MNVTELSRRLRMDTRDLLVLLPQLGFDIGRRAIKVDDRVAQKIIEQWPVLMKKLRAQTEDSAAAAAAGPDAAVAKRQVPVPATLSVREFAQRAGLPVTKVLAVLMRDGGLASI